MNSKLAKYLLVKLSHAMKKQKNIMKAEEVYDMLKELDVAENLLNKLKKKNEVDSELYIKIHNKISLLRNMLKEKEKFV